MYVQRLIRRVKQQIFYETHEVVVFLGRVLTIVDVLIHLCDNFVFGVGFNEGFKLELQSLVHSFDVLERHS